MAEEKDNTVYISYASKSKRIYDEIAKHYNVETNSVDHERDSFVHRLYNQLTAEGIPCKLDDVDVQGGSITEFEQAIGNANYVVVVLSDKYFISPHCMYEWDLIHKDAEVKKIYYVYFTGETIRCEDGTEFKGINCPIKDEHKDYYPKVIKPVWEKRYKNLRDELDYTYRELSAVEAYFCNGDINKNKDISSPISKAYLFKKSFESITSILKNVAVIKDTNEGEEKKVVQYIKNKLGWKTNSVSPTLGEKSDERSKLPSAILSKFQKNSFIPRDSDVKNVADLLDMKKVVNITGIGGCGKSTVSILYLVGTQDTESKYKNGFQDRYSCVTDIIINNEDVYKDFCDTFVDERHVVEYVKQRVEDTQPDYYQTFLSILRYLNDCPTEDKPMLLVMDVNETANYAQVKEVIKKFVDICKNWKLLVVSREVLCDDKQDFIDISRVDTIEFSFIKRLFLYYVDKNGFRSKCEAIDDNDLMTIFSKLGNLPVLIRALADFWNAECTVSSILDYLGDGNLSPEIKELQVSSINKEGVKAEIYNQIGNFLSLLCIFKNLPSDLHKNVVRCMMLWDADYYPKKFIQKAVSGTSSMNPVFNQTLSDLENRCLLDSRKDSNDVLEYKMHGLIAQTCREQVFASQKTIIDSNTGKKKVVDNPDYEVNAPCRNFSDYIRNICSNVIGKNGFDKDFLRLIKKRGFLKLIQYKGFDDFYYSWLDSLSGYSSNIDDNISDNPFINDYVNNMVFVKRGQSVYNDFYIGKTQVTQNLWQAVMGFNPSNFTPKIKAINKRGITDTSKFPVEQVSWFDCFAFIMKLNEITHLKFRLPSETEWEYAAGWRKDGGWNKYSGCDNEGLLNKFAWYTENSKNITHEVATRLPNELGIYDMSGNVWEWCQDLYESSGSSRVLRGGSWDDGAYNCRVSIRNSSDPGFRNYSRGLRLALPCSPFPS